MRPEKRIRLAHETEKHRHNWIDEADEREEEALNDDGPTP
jgi:hypothetical protein